MLRSHPPEFYPYHWPPRKPSALSITPLDTMKPTEKFLDQAYRARSRSEQLLDQAYAKTTRALFGGGLSVPYDGDTRFALLSVNYSTTGYLKLMLLTLAEQNGLDRIRSIIVCDNASKDAGLPFLRQLAEAVDRVILVENRWWTNHASGMRSALRALDSMDKKKPAIERANVLLACDPDVLFLRDDTLDILAGIFANSGAAFAGELRRGLCPLPEAQASFLAVRRDWAARRDVSPWVFHGSPAYWMQRDIWQLGGTGEDFQSNQAGFTLHRGRSAVTAATKYAPWSTYGRTPHEHRSPHYMGVPGGRQIWAIRANQFADLLEPEAESALLWRLAESFAA
ncbi:MAG TPA: hypothetical protein DDY14_04685 [Chromatiaceae bacterium]|jgi:hypothetical protein|nr:MAG: hypothetical protein N838_12490 [Thiohalocapsa sp. PB-PSB1]QQO51998.1 MAG: hypothetical protein N838_00050 [Thiohalocapsa sp. PB-PSB1]HBG94620.1 hypothetical protein [Chromatiaceae bacterium]HCS91109.1 hypothetical protein [Chromatiaceae bacterium]